MAVSAGDLDKAVVLKKPVSTRIDGEKVNTYTNAASVRASVKQTNQVRAIEHAPLLIGTDKVVFRYSSITKEIKKDWLVNYDGKDHVIHTIDIKEKQFIELIVKGKDG